MIASPRCLALFVGLAILFSRTVSASEPTAPLQFTIAGCSNIDPKELERLLAIELGGLRGMVLEIELQCDAGSVAERVSAAGIGELRRVVPLSNDAYAQERELALSIAETALALQAIPQRSAAAAPPPPVVVRRAPHALISRPPPVRRIPPPALFLAMGVRVHDPPRAFANARFQVVGEWFVGQRSALLGSVAFEQGSVQRTAAEVQTRVVSACLGVAYSTDPARTLRGSVAAIIGIERAEANGQSSNAKLRGTSLSGFAIDPGLEITSTARLGPVSTGPSLGVGYGLPRMTATVPAQSAVELAGLNFSLSWRVGWQL